MLTRTRNEGPCLFSADAIDLRPHWQADLAAQQKQAEECARLERERDQARRAAQFYKLKYRLAEAQRALWEVRTALACFRRPCCAAWIAAQVWRALAVLLVHGPSCCNLEHGGLRMVLPAGGGGAAADHRELSGFPPAGPDHRRAAGGGR